MMGRAAENAEVDGGNRNLHVLAQEVAAPGAGRYISWRRELRERPTRLIPLIDVYDLASLLQRLELLGQC